MSPCLKEKLVYIGQLDCYERGGEIAEYLLGIKTNDTAIYRLTDQVGLQCEELVKDVDFRKSISLKRDEKMYVQCDGSMLLTREDGWKEVKLGRVFKSSAIHSERADRQWIRSSEYVAHLGLHSEFENKMSMIVDEVYKTNKDRVIFVGDGARWMWSWCEAEYPQAIQILDFYHAMEHIGQFIKSISNSTIEQDKYMKKLGHILKYKGVDTVERYLSNIPLTSQKKQEEYRKLKTYMTNNRKRMDYPKYIADGYLIGSGAIESAHRTVLQKRMKQSGQRWSIKGLKRMMNLRVLYMSGYKDEVVNRFIKMAA